MAQIPFIFKQLTDCLPADFFKALVKKYKANAYIKDFTCWNHLSVMIWAQLTSRSSLRDIVSSLKAHSDKTYRMGMGNSISRSNLGYANAHREIALYREMACTMMELSAGVAVKEPLMADIIRTFGLKGFFAVDSSSISLPLDRFSWSVPQEGVGGIKLHVMFDLLRKVPLVCCITGHEERDQTFLDEYPFEQGCIYVMDKMFVKTPSLYNIHRKGAYFVTRIKSNMKYEVTDERDSQDIRVLADHTIRFTSRWARSAYGETLRLITYYSAEINETLMFLTNNFDVDAATIALLYAFRWDIEVFFKWIKQHLIIKRFYGTSGNAVFIQIYCAIITYCLLAIVFDSIKFKGSLFEFISIVSVTLTERVWLRDVIHRNENSPENGRQFDHESSQLLLFQ